MPQKAKFPVVGIIVAAGHSQRFGGPVPKPFARLGQVSILAQTARCLENLDHLMIVINPAHTELYRAAMQGHTSPSLSHVAGGQTRQESVYNGLMALKQHVEISDNTRVIIHDAARPLLHLDDLALFLEALEHHDNCALAQKVTDTLYAQHTGYLNRDHIYHLQTPQGFKFHDLLAAHAEAALKHLSFTDDTSLMSELRNIPPHLVIAQHPNFKITHPQDIVMANALSELSSQPRIIRMGSGFDVHAFAPAESKRPLILGGISINHPRGLAGHSDADVVLHALCDALYGALGTGDIGQHFPPSDAKNKDRNSSDFIQHAIEQLHAHRGQIHNIDITIICETPKIGPHSASMKSRLAQLLGIQETQIGIKATTTEGLGFTGRGEGIAAQALVCISIP